MATVYTVTVDAGGLDEDEVMAEARKDAAEFFETTPDKVTAEVISFDIGGYAVVKVDRRSGTLLG